jgi:hypothetical protein
VDDDPVLVYVASHTQGGMAWGGHLVATSNRIVFTPTPKNVELGGQAWSATLSEIREVGTKGRTWNLRDGGLRTRLRFAMNDGHDEPFGVYNVKRAVEELSFLLAERRR